jgi:hypothetical protein
MKRILISMLITVTLLTACAIVPAGQRGHSSGGVMIAPFLPPIVVLGVEPYYYYSDFHYRYTNDRWYYSRSRRGPWAELPRNRYPKEVRFKGKDRNQKRGPDKDNRRHRGRYDDQRYRDWDQDNRRR